VYSITGGGAATLVSGPNYSDYEPSPFTPVMNISITIVYEEREQRFAYLVQGDVPTWRGSSLYAYDGVNVPVHPYYNYPQFREKLTLPPNTPMRRKIVGTETLTGAYNPQFIIPANQAGYSYRCWTSGCTQHYGTLNIDITPSGVAQGPDAPCGSGAYALYEHFNQTYNLDWIVAGTGGGESLYSPLGYWEIPGRNPLEQELMTFNSSFWACYDESNDETNLYVRLTDLQGKYYGSGYYGGCDDLGGGTISSAVRYKKTISGRVDLRTLSGEVLDFELASFGALGATLGTYIDFTGSTCTVTADP